MMKNTTCKKNNKTAFFFIQAMKNEEIPLIFRTTHTHKKDVRNRIVLTYSVIEVIIILKDIFIL